MCEQNELHSTHESCPVLSRKAGKVRCASLMSVCNVKRRAKRATFLSIFTRVLQGVEQSEPHLTHKSCSVPRVFTTGKRAKWDAYHLEPVYCRKIELSELRVTYCRAFRNARRSEQRFTSAPHKKKLGHSDRDQTPIIIHWSNVNYSIFCGHLK